MRKIIFAVIVLHLAAPAQVNNFNGNNAFPKINGFVYVDGYTYTTVQQAINALP